MKASLVLLLFAVAAFFSPVSAASSAQEQVVAATKASGVSVVHLWAPWCGNCKAELKSGGWTKTVTDNPEVKFYFVSVWNSGEDGRAMLETHGIGQQPNVTILADPGPRGTGRIKEFAGLPLSWIPTTWIFKGGELRYALNYGEVRFPVLQQFIADSSSDWAH